MDKSASLRDVLDHDKACSFVASVLSPHVPLPVAALLQAAEADGVELSPARLAIAVRTLRDCGLLVRACKRHGPGKSGYTMAMPLERQRKIIEECAERNLLLPDQAGRSEGQREVSAGT